MFLVTRFLAPLNRRSLLELVYLLLLLQQLFLHFTTFPSVGSSFWAMSLFHLGRPFLFPLSFYYFFLMASCWRSAEFDQLFAHWNGSFLCCEEVVFDKQVALDLSALQCSFPVDLIKQAESPRASWILLSWSSGLWFYYWSFSLLPEFWTP